LHKSASTSAFYTINVHLHIRTAGTSVALYEQFNPLALFCTHTCQVQLSFIKLFHRRRFNHD